MEKLSLQQAKEIPDQDVLDYLKEFWNIQLSTSIHVWGMIRKEKTSYRLINARLGEGVFIEYPIKDLLEAKHIQIAGLPISEEETSIKKYFSDGERYISCQLILESQSNRDKLNNPFALKINSISIELLDELPNKKVVRSKRLNELNVQIEKLEEFLLNKEINNKKILDERKALKIKLNEDLERFKSDREIDKQKLIDEIEILKINLNSEIEEFRLAREADKKKITEKIVILDKKLKNKEEEMGRKLEKLRMYIKDKADALKDLEFIDQKEYDNLLMINKRDKSDEKFVDFENDLQSDKQNAITHIQAYLHANDIFYPRYILEDFLALIQTNDLIILAGESGSGKTNLIKSFAKAIGGKSFIIPVKPNWTSSEDLLGYYNPLEKKYLTTPFLEALLEAKDNPDIPYFICLDEMNLARVEYYFADFLSLLEERGEQPEIKLYSEDESSHILSEFKNVMDVIEHVKEKYKKKNIVNFIQLLQDEEINKELTRIFGFSDKDSLIKYHTDLRRMLSGILNTPSSITFPTNVRIIGAINIDETTHYLSPKILDRAHIMKFDSPLLQDWDKIENEIEDVENKKLKIKFKIEDLGSRKDYPSFDRNNEFCKIITDMTRKYFSPLGIEVGLRTIRQGLNYQKIFIEQGSNEELVLNNFILHKILPKMTFDGSKSIEENVTKKNVLLDFIVKLEIIIHKEDVGNKGIYVIKELKKIVKNAESNDEIVNYWA